MTPILDLTKKKIGKLQVLFMTGETNLNNQKVWKCLCDCGTTCFFSTGELKHGAKTHCGCIKQGLGPGRGRKPQHFYTYKNETLSLAELATKYKIDYDALHKRVRVQNWAIEKAIETAYATYSHLKEVFVGQKFEKLLVIKKSERKISDGACFWECLCDCENTTTVRAGHLRAGTVKSCGCLVQETNERSIAEGWSIGDRSKTHGLWDKTSIYGTWQAMLARCTNLNNQAWEHYGGRGIKVCERWRHSFENFYNDMGEKPSPEHSIDRYPDNDGDYEPGNCRWATQTEQVRNRRNNRLLTYKNETFCLNEMAERYNLRPQVLTKRLKLGWSIEEAIEKPLKIQNHSSHC